jgi:hypothetical protein
MDERPKRAPVVWIAAQLMLLFGFQVICIVVAAAICIAIFPPRWGLVASLASAPAAMAIGIISAILIGRRIRG